MEISCQILSVQQGAGGIQEISFGTTPPPPSSHRSGIWRRDSTPQRQDDSVAGGNLGSHTLTPQALPPEARRQDPVEIEDYPGHNTAAPVQETLHGCQPVAQEDGKESRISVQERQVTGSIALRPLV